MSQDRQTKLDSPISSVTPERLETTRQEVDAVRMKLDEHDKSIHIEAGDLISDRPPPLPSPGDLEAEARLDKLNLIQDVQLILVDKYRQGTRIMWVAILLLVAGSGGIISLYVKLTDAITEVTLLKDDLRQVVNNVARIADSQSKIEKSTDKTQVALEETNTKLDAAVEASPKIEVDAKGNTKLVVPVKTANPKASKPQPQPKPVPTQISVEPKKL